MSRGQKNPPASVDVGGLDSLAGSSAAFGGAACAGGAAIAAAAAAAFGAAAKAAAGGRAVGSAADGNLTLVAGLRGLARSFAAGAGAACYRRRGNLLAIGPGGGRRRGALASARAVVRGGSLRAGLSFHVSAGGEGSVAVAAAVGTSVLGG